MFNSILIIFLAASLFTGTPGELPRPATTISTGTQENDVWKVLFGVKYGDWRSVYKPQFNEQIKALDGKKITIRGFLIPLEEKPKHSFFLLSAYPFDACFYCGKAGPETVIEVTCKTPLKDTKTPITITGTLKLNYSSPEHLFYIIKDGEVVKN